MLPDNVTCGQETVAVRMPSHPIALEIIENCGFPLAAPSANSSGCPSPTLANHVLHDLNGVIPCVVDSGPCDVGVESTVLDLLRSPPAILRPGGVTFEMLLPFCPDLKVYKKDFTDKNLEMNPTTPGMKYKHYSPHATVFLFEGSAEEQRNMILDSISELRKADKSTSIGLMHTAESDFDVEYKFSLGSTADAVARNIYSGLRFLDDCKVEFIFINGISECDEGLAVMNRLRKAATKVLRK